MMTAKRDNFYSLLVVGGKSEMDSNRRNLKQPTTLRFKAQRLTFLHDAYTRGRSDTPVSLLY